MNDSALDIDSSSPHLVSRQINAAMIGARALRQFERGDFSDLELMAEAQP